MLAIRKGEHGTRSSKHAIVIGLSEARRAGVKLYPPKGTVSEKTRTNAMRESDKGQRLYPIFQTRSRTNVKALKKELTSSVSNTALSRQAKSAARKRTSESRCVSARKASRSKKSH